MKWHQQMHSVGFQLHLDAFHRCRALLFQDDKEFTVAVYSKNLAATLNFSTLEVLQLILKRGSVTLFTKRDQFW